MNSPFEVFARDVAEKCSDKQLRQRIALARQQREIAFEDSAKQFSNLEMARRRVAFARWKALENLDSYLIQFESNFIKTGGKVFWAQSAKEACDEVAAIIKKAGARYVVQSRSLVADEIELGNALEELEVIRTETDAGQFILQLGKEKPVHPVNPALHISGNQVQSLFAENLGVETDPDPQSLVSAASKFIHERNKEADIGITGADFIVAEQGAVVISEDEGSAALAASRPKVHIVLAGIDRVLPSLLDLHVMWPVYSTYSSGKKINTYNTILTGPRKNGDADGPAEMYVILIDNGRSSVLAKEIPRRILSCINCGSCHFADPVFRILGGHPYRSTWTGPPGAAIQPVLHGMKTHSFYNMLSTLSGADSTACPVNIHFNRVAFENRRLAIQEQAIPAADKLYYFLWKRAMMKREIINWRSLRPRNFFVYNLFMKSPMELRSLRPAAKTSFNEMWRKRLGM